VLDTRLSNTATHADWWVAPYPGSEAAILLAIANHLIQSGSYDREFVRRWWNWQEYLDPVMPGEAATFERFEGALRSEYAAYTFAFAAQESGVDASTIETIAHVVAGAGTRLSTHTWRSAAAGNLGGWQVSRALFLLNALLGAVATTGGTFPNAWNKFSPRPIHVPPHPHVWNHLTWPEEFPLAMNELSFLLPQFLKEGRGRLDVYFTRVYNPVWTNPDGFSWIEALTDESKVGLHVALTPTWNETSYFADYILPMGLGAERHDIHSYETHDGQWIGFRQPVLREARRRLGQVVSDTRHANPGEVWEENEFWIELTWRVDPDGSLGIRRYVESAAHPGQKLGVDEYYAYLFEHSVPGLAARAQDEGMTPLQYMRRYGAFEISRQVGALHEQPVGDDELISVGVNRFGRVYTAAPRPASLNVVPLPTPEPDANGRRPVGVVVDGHVLRGFPTPSGRLEFYSRTLADWGWPEYALPTYIRSHIHPDALAAGEMPLIPTFRLPVQIHTRSANAKWLDEIAHTNPLWIHPSDATRIGVATGDLVRVETHSGHFVVRAWVTEGIRAGVLACSHHMGRWKIGNDGQRQLMATAVPAERHGVWSLSRTGGVEPYESSDPDTARIWWREGGVHQNLAFPVHPDPISGMHCWHQAVRVRRAEPDDRYGEVFVDIAKAAAVYRTWLERCRPARQVSPDGTRRPYWLLRPLKPAKEAYVLPGIVEAAPAGTP
jgi:anaerobic selenocysteine-containing dehydrogenase